MSKIPGVQHIPEKMAQLNAAAYIFLKKEGKMFFLRRANVKYRNGLYNVPAGRLDVGETIYDCAIRETKEEAGVDVKKEDLKTLCVTHRLLPSDYDYNNWVDFFFYAEKWDGTPHIAEPEKADDSGWFSIDELAGKIVPNQEHAFLNGNINEILIQLETNTDIQKI